ncbi:Hsp20/alpha crystallin family protein [Bdellovibrio sp. HCB290]|uniref:Hsp20/alpha crystallin family protein n=1 Tax=Bdellovibrio sp. HCB290 TaxID=3394356 RepID=UPI0039B6D06F
MRMLSPLSTDWSWTRRSLSPDRRVNAFDDFDRVVESFLLPKYASTVNFQPSCDIHEGKDQYLVSFDMPGLKKEDIKVEVQGSNLVISGERQREVSAQDGDATIYHERAYGKFERTFVMPSSINAEKIEAHYENGVLNVALPKAESAKGRTIQIQTEQDGIFSKLLGSKKESTKELKDVKVS